MLPPSHPGRIIDRLEVGEAELVRELLDNGGVSIALQPVVTINAPRVVGWEALVRAHHPQMGPIPPLVLVDVAKQNGMLDELTRQVADLAIDALDRACELVDDQLLVVTVNVELEQFYASNPFIEWLLQRELPSKGQFVLEITERDGDTWTPAHERAARLLVARGIDLALDDVGAGHSRIGFFRHREWQLVKIDQSFLTWETERDRKVIELFVHMIHGLGLASLAEGIETVEHLLFAQSLGIRYGQGYWLGHPEPVEDVLAELRERGTAIETSF